MNHGLILAAKTVMPSRSSSLFGNNAGVAGAQGPAPSIPPRERSSGALPRPVAQCCVFRTVRLLHRVLQSQIADQKGVA